MGNVAGLISRAFQRLNHLTLGAILLLLGLQTVGSFLLYTLWWGHEPMAWLREVFISTTVLLAVGAFALFALQRTRRELTQSVSLNMVRVLRDLEATNSRAASLQAMASTLSATLSFERVVEQALGVCSLALEDMGVERDSLVGAVFLFDGQALVPLARRRFLAEDDGQALLGERGVVGEALREAEPAVTDDPTRDPELSAFNTFAECLTAVCVPLRAGYQLFGVMVLGTATAVRFEEDHFELFMAVADQTVIALQNAELYQRLEAEKQRLIEVDEAARRKLARDLHDGPTQKVAAIAMRLSALKIMAGEQPERLPEELAKLETLATQTSKEIRGMLFTLRPLLLESRGLGPAIETLLNDLQDSTAVQTNLSGAEAGEALSERTQGVVFAVIEEALSNVRKHAGAGSVEVQMAQEEDLFVARIHDDGAGFDPQEVSSLYRERGNLGMLNMQERAARLDGSLRVESAPGAGTTITLIVPLAKNGRDLDPDIEAAATP